MSTTLTNEDYNALQFRAIRGKSIGRGELAGNHGDSTDYRAMRSCVEAMKCSLPASRVAIETNQNASAHDVAEYLLSTGARPQPGFGHATPGHSLANAVRS